QQEGAAAQACQLLVGASSQPGQEIGVALKGLADGAAGGGHDQQVGLFGQLQAAIDLDQGKVQLYRLTIEAEALQQETRSTSQVIGQGEGVLRHAQAGADSLWADVQGNAEHGMVSRKDWRLLTQSCRYGQSPFGISLDRLGCIHTCASGGRD